MRRERISECDKFAARASMNRAAVLALVLVHLFASGVTSASSADAEIDADFSIPENGRPPQAVGQINISRHLSPGDKVQFYQDEFDPFCGDESCIDVDRSTGQVTVRRPLDREEACPDLSTIECVLHFRVVAKVRSPSASVESTLDVRLKLLIVDVNDYVPTFDKPVYTLEVPEDQRPNTIIQPELPLVVDFDGPRYRVTDCVLESPDTGVDLPFDLEKVRTVVDGVSLIERLNLRLKPGASLDRERVPSYTVLLRARDGPQDDLVYNTATMTVRIVVLDVNDNDPVVRPSYNVTVSESHPVGSRVLRIEATDADSGRNGQLVYSIPAGDRPRIGQQLELNATTGEIWNKRLFNYEQRNLYQFSVIVSDRGSPARSATTTVTIYVTDVNDEKPQVCIVQNDADGNEVCGSGEAGTTTVVQENQPVSTFVAKLRVSDADSNPLYRNVSCEWVTTEDFFYLERLPTDFGRNVHYALRTSVSLDRELHSTYSLPLVCTDGPTESAQTTTQILLVKVGDENDNKPQFDSESISIDRDEEEPLTIHVRKAIDVDEAENGTVRYSLKDDFGKFRIDAETALLTSVALDREAQAKYDLVIVAHDLGNVTRLSSSIVYSLTLLDVNDHDPIVQPSYTFHIREDVFADGRTQLVDFGSLNVSDPDEGENGDYKCELPGQQTATFAQLPFSVFSNCEVIFNAIPLDRERASQYNGTVIVRDMGSKPRSSTVYISVVVDDVNDCAPRITHPLNETNITLFVSLGVAYPADMVPFVTVVARDADEPNTPNSRLHFAFAGSMMMGNLFVIDPDTGEIRLQPNRSLTQADIGNYRVEVIVRDAGEPQLGSWVTFRILVKVTENELSAFGADRSMPNILMFVGVVVGFLVIASVLITAIMFTTKRLRIQRTKSGQKKRTPTKEAASHDPTHTPLNAALAYALAEDSAGCSPNATETVSCLMCDSLTLASGKTCYATTASNVSVGVPCNQVCAARSQRLLVGSPLIGEHVMIDAKLNGGEDEQHQQQQPICEHCYVQSYPTCLQMQMQMQMQPANPYCTVIPNAPISCHCPSDEGFSQTRTTDSNSSSIVRFPAICQDHMAMPRIDHALPISNAPMLNPVLQTGSPNHRIGSYTSMPVDALYFSNPNYNVLPDRSAPSPSAAAFVPKPLFPMGVGARQYGTLKKLAGPNSNSNGNGNGAGRLTPMSIDNDALTIGTSDSSEKAYSTTQSFTRLHLAGEKKNSVTNLQAVLPVNNNNNNSIQVATLNHQQSAAPERIQDFSDSSVV